MPYYSLPGTKFSSMLKSLQLPTQSRLAAILFVVALLFLFSSAATLCASAILLPEILPLKMENGRRPSVFGSVIVEAETSSLSFDGDMLLAAENLRAIIVLFPASNVGNAGFKSPEGTRGVP